MARDPEASDSVIADVKRRIDKLNQLRNDAIEAIDKSIQPLKPLPGAKFNTETPGSVIDRLSILTLRIYHLAELLVSLAPDIHEKYKTCVAQHSRLSRSLDELLEDIYAGRKQHIPFQQLKMYNDPNLNPVLARREA